MITQKSLRSIYTLSMSYRSANVIKIKSRQLLEVFFEVGNAFVESVVVGGFSDGWLLVFVFGD